MAAEEFFKAKKKTMGTSSCIISVLLNLCSRSAIVPLIVVYTIFDSLVDDVMFQLAMSSHGQPGESIAEQAHSKAESSVQERHKEIDRFAGEKLPHAAVSSKRVWS